MVKQGDSPRNIWNCDWIKRFTLVKAALNSIVIFLVWLS